jgi:chromosome segregation ATPase
MAGHAATGAIWRRSPERLLTLTIIEPIVAPLEGLRHRRVVQKTAGSLMARGRAEKARRGTAPGTEPVRRGTSKVGSAEGKLVEAKSVEANLRERLAVVERERDALLSGLHRAQARILSLEKTQTQVRDRIAWALESLHNVLEGKG